MRVTTIRQPELSQAASSGNQWAQKMVVSAFSRIDHGRLLIEQNGQSMTLGESAADTTLTARVEIGNEETWSLILQKGVIGAAESYMLGFWTTPDLVAVIRVMVSNMQTLMKIESQRSIWRSAALKLYGLLHRNNVDNARRNISAHYDLGNEFFELFLDQQMMYSAAIYQDGVECLEQAAVDKLEAICSRLDLQADDHLLEIGTGWGGFACYAAAQYGCQVTTTTISEQQYLKAIERVESMGLQDRVTVLLKDYRHLEGQYDKLVSIEMIEAVGHEYYADYFSKCSSLLKADGSMLIQAILMSDQRYDDARRRVDFIKRYIFPGGCLPSVHEISRQLRHETDMHLQSVDDMTYDYALTLREWRERFLAKLDDVRAQGYDDAFIRMWEFYLAYCEGGFMERSIHTAQLVFTKPQWRDRRYPQ